MIFGVTGIYMMHRKRKETYCYLILYAPNKERLSMAEGHTVTDWLNQSRN